MNIPFAAERVGRKARPGFPNLLPRVIARAFAALCLIMAVVGLVTPAEANTAPNGATWYPVQTYCDVYSNYLSRDMFVKPQPGWASQYVTYRTYGLNTRTNQGSWSGWAQERVYAGSGSTVKIGGGAPMPDGLSYRFYTEFMWWNGSRWTSRVGAWDTHFTNAGGGYVRTNACLT